MTHTEAIDAYFADCVRCVLESENLPDFPDKWADNLAELRERLDFHGIALLLANGATELANWPNDLVQALQEQARLQAIWEADHSAAIANLINALQKASITAIIMKGTALAYSVHRDPAVRRRGDTDLLIETSQRNHVRRVFGESGFKLAGEQRPLQETWNLEAPSGFIHQVDLHWAASSSFAISAAIERDHLRDRKEALPRLSPIAVSAGPIDTFIQICINRSGHSVFGYNAGDRKLMDGDRLIWAVDLHLLAAGFSESDIADLIAIAERWGASRSVASGIAFARRVTGVQFPESIEPQLSQGVPRNDISDYFEAGSAYLRFKKDFVNARGVRAKLAFAWHQTFPGREFMGERYPHQRGWPMAALYVRRLLDGATKILLGSPR